jgi:cell wall-associated NlpC family hydrolase
MFLLKPIPVRALLLLTVIATFAASCGTLKKASAPAAEHSTKKTQPNNTANSPVFIDNISFKPGSETYPDPPPPVETKKIDKSPEKINTSEAIEVLPSAKFKYAILLDAPVEDLNDNRLVDFLDTWYGTPYRLGGSDQNGIDCSAFVQSFFTALYGINVSRTCREQYSQSRRITRKQLQEGDLVFFKTRGRSVSHVGVYLRNNKFIHASTSSGVMISDLSDSYFAKRYVGAGRF